MPAKDDSGTDFVYMRSPSSEIPMPTRPEIPVFPEGSEDREILRTIHNMVSNVHQDVHDTRCQVVQVQRDQTATSKIVVKHNQLVKSVLRIKFQVALLWASAGVLLVLVAGTVWDKITG